MVKNYVTLREGNPEAADMWAYDLNDSKTNPDNVGVASTKVVYFRCKKNSKHVFKKRIGKMKSDRDGHCTGCVYCGHSPKLAFPGETDFFTVVPEAKKMWDFDKNHELDPTKLLPRSNKKAYFKCSRGHQVYRVINNFYRSPVCPECLIEPYKLEVALPNTRLFWRFEKNLELDYKSTQITSKKEAFFKCPECKYEWSWQVRTWKRNGAFCPCCGFDGDKDSKRKNKSAVAKNNIKTLEMVFPDVIKWWDFEKNGIDTPYSVTYASNKDAWFVCPKNHSFSRSIIGVGKIRKVTCPICDRHFGKVFLGVNDFFSTCKEAEKMWMKDKNKSIDPHRVTANSYKKAFFKCEQNHEFEKVIRTFALYPTCPTCEFIKNNSIWNNRPEVLKFWDYRKMAKSPKEVNVTSYEKGYWKCPRCRYEWEQSFYQRCASKVNKCPNCEIRNKNGFTKSLKIHNPEVIKYIINDDTCPIDLETISSRSTKIVKLRCPYDESHIFKKSIRGIPLKEPFGCPYCSKGSRRIVIKGATDFFTIVPKAKEMWDWDKNKKLNPYALLPNSRKKAFFLCEEGHSFIKELNNFTRSQRCPVCFEINKMYVNKYPHILKQWDYQKNKQFNVRATLAMSQEVVWWRCDKCGYEWKAQIKSRRDSKGECPSCETRIVIVEGTNDLFSVVPQLRSIYDFEKNKGIDPKQISLSFNQPLWWKCQECGYNWKSNVSTRIKGNYGNYDFLGCPFCEKRNLSRKRIVYGKEYPSLISMFLEKLNGCSLSDVNNLAQSNVKYWWNCKFCGLNFKSTVDLMIRSINTKFHGCSYCSGHLVDIRKSFAILHPDLMDEFSPDNKVDPYKYTEKSSKKVKWVCRKNYNHTWYATFQARTDGKGNCNFCRGYTYGKMLYITRPNLKPFFDNEKNNRPFETYTNQSNEKLWWKCKNNHSFRQAAYLYSNSEVFYCPICKGDWLIKGVNTIKDFDPKLEEEWGTQNEQSISDYTYKSKYAVYWICRNCKGEYLDRICDKCEGNAKKCPYCTNKRPLKGFNTIKDKYPELLSEWSLNNKKTASDYVYKSERLFLWICSDCKGEYLETVKNKNEFEDNCPYCTNKRPLRGLNTIGDKYPELMFEWSANNRKTPFDYVYKSKRPFLWMCHKCGGEYSTTVYDKLMHYKCPYCDGEKLLTGFNSFDVKHPDLLEQWDYVNNYFLLDPSQAFDNCSIKVWWICKNNKSHKYHMSPKQLLYYLKRKKNPCLYCKGRRRKKRHFL
jgi:hypothetical protein